MNGSCLSRGLISAICPLDFGLLLELVSTKISAVYRSICEVVQSQGLGLLLVESGYYRFHI